MKHKLMSAAGCLLLLAAAMVPSALGHDDNGSRAGDVDGGVAGTFYGSAGWCVAFNGPPITILSPPLSPQDTDFSLCVRGLCLAFNGPTITILSPPLSPQDTDFSLCSFGSIQCDKEVLGDGTSNQEPDETRVDGLATGVGALPDGTFDDGGQGGACHTNHYDLDAYNTPGCPANGARASNLAPLAAPWVGASCDWKTVEGGTPQSDILVGCVVNGVLDGIDDQPAEAIQCVVDFLACVLNPLTCASDGVESCGSDSVADGINFGAGNGRTAYPNGPSTDPNTFTGDGLGCTSGDATAVVFAFTGVAVTDGVAVTVNPAVQGDVWTVA